MPFFPKINSGCFYKITELSSIITPLRQISACNVYQHDSHRQINSFYNRFFYAWQQLIFFQNIGKSFWADFALISHLTCISIV